MTSEIRRSLLLGMAGVLAGCGGGDSDTNNNEDKNSSETVKKSKWTIFLYFNGVDAESGFKFDYYSNSFYRASEGGVLSENIRETLQALPSTNVNILIQTGGSWKQGWKTIRRFKVTNQAQVELSPPINPNASMDNADTVADMMKWGATDFPAERYGLIIVGHGGGPLRGYAGGDQLQHGDEINGLGFQNLMNQAMKFTGQKIEFLGLNSCLMSYYELASGISESTNYLIASEETIPFSGFDFAAMFNFLSRNPDADGLQVGKRIVNSYIEKNKANPTITLAVTDLSRTAAVQSALDPIFKILTQKIQQEGLPAWHAIAATRAQSLDFHSNIYTGVEVDAMDMASFFRVPRYSSLGISASLTQNALTAIDSLAPLKRWGKAMKETCGMTMYFPSVSLRAPANLNLYQQRNPLSASQKEFIQTYSSFAHNGGVPAVTVGNVMPGVSNMISATASSEHYEWAYAALLNSSRELISMQSIAANSQQLSLNHHSIWPTIDGVPVHMAPSNDASHGEGVFIIPAQLLRGSNFMSVLLYAEETQDGTYQARTYSSFDQNENHVSSPVIYPIMPGMTFVFCSVTYMNGSIQLQRRPQIFRPNALGSVEIQMQTMGASQLAGCSVHLGVCDYMGRLSLSSNAYPL